MLQTGLYDPTLKKISMNECHFGCFSFLPPCRSAMREDTRGEFREGEFSDAISRFAALRRKPCE